MKTLKHIGIAIFIISALLFLAGTFCRSFGQTKTCPIYGNKANQKYRMNDSLKNRNITGEIDTSVTLEDILSKEGNEFSSSQYTSLKGYVILVKYGGSETCNCGSKVKSDLDIHIELASSPDDKGKDAMIIEINRYTRKDHPELSLENLKKYVGKKVESEGFLFADVEHTQNSVNSNPTGTNLWRKTKIEQHPCMSIKLAE